MTIMTAIVLVWSGQWHVDHDSQQSHTHEHILLNWTLIATATSRVEYASVGHSDKLLVF